MHPAALLHVNLARFAVVNGLLHGFHRRVHLQNQYAYVVVPRRTYVLGSPDICFGNFENLL